jgi:hypothetical protein
MWDMRPITITPRGACTECGSLARLIQLRRGDAICGACMTDLRRSAAKCFVAPQDVEKVIGPPRLF